MTNKQFMRSLRLTTEPRFLTPFEHRLIRYHQRDEVEARQAFFFGFSAAALMWGLVCIL